MRDEVNEPLGPPRGARSPRARAGRAWSVLSATAALALVISALVLARTARPPHAESLAAIAVAKAEPVKLVRAQPVAAKPAPVELTPAPRLDPSETKSLPPSASAEQVEAASGVKVTRNGGAEAPRALIIDVAQALASASIEATRAAPALPARDAAAAAANEQQASRVAR